jgi:3-deoxy-manno-octulosonate cytidylyltransferase (CMP-KDO synthetase)
MTSPDHPSGSDRIYEALCRYDPDGRYDAVINLQGDLPTVRPATVRAAAALLDSPEVAIGTPVAEIVSEDENSNSSVVKMVGAMIGPDRFRVLYFTRTAAPWGDGPLYHHIGLYAWRRSALEKFIALPPSPLERRERLEQLGVDTPGDLGRARGMIERGRTTWGAS